MIGVAHGLFLALYIIGARLRSSNCYDVIEPSYPSTDRRPHKYQSHIQSERLRLCTVDKMINIMDTVVTTKLSGRRSAPTTPSSQKGTYD
jgi:hypothetical protein